MPAHLASALPVLLAMGFVAVLLSGIALALAFQLRVPRGAVRVIGEVTGFHRYRHRGSVMCSPRFRVVLHDGRVIEGGARSGTAKSWESPPVGTRVELFYDREDPEAPLSETGIARYVVPIILLGLGVFVGGLGIVISAGIVFGG